MNGVWKYIVIVEDLPNHLILGKASNSLDDKIEQPSTLSWVQTLLSVYIASLSQWYFRAITHAGYNRFCFILLLCISILRRILRHLNSHRDDSRIWRIMAVLYCVCIYDAFRLSDCPR